MKSLKIKKYLLLVCITLFICSAAFATPAAINFENLPTDKKFSQLFLDFGNAYDYIRYPDFENKDAKKDQIKAAKNLYTFLKKKKKPNYDESLLQLLAARCLYNFDELDFPTVEKLFLKIDSNFPENPEHHWIYGNFLVTTGSKITDGYDELTKYMEMKDYYISGAFIEDYAYAQFLCNMPINALYSITNGGTIPEETIQNQSLLSIIKNHIKESSSSEQYESNQVWKLSALKDEYHTIYSTMLGISFPCKPDWALRINSFSANSPAMLMLGPNDFSIDGNNVGISILMLVYPNSIYSDSIKDKLVSSFNVIQTDTCTISKHNFEKYTYEDLSKYNDIRKGARGYLYAATIEPEKWSGIRCEQVVDIAQYTNSSDSDSSGEPRYYAIQPTQNRLQEPVTVIIVVDSCVALSEETDALLEELFSKAVFE